MSLTVGDLKSILDIDSSNYDELLFYFENKVTNELFLVQDVKVITQKTITFPDIEVLYSYFCFLCNNTSPIKIDKYSDFESLLDSASNDFPIVFVNEDLFKKETDELNYINIDSIKFEIKISKNINSVSGEKKTGKIFLIKENQISSSSSSI